jgi:ribonuclease T1
VLRAAASFRLLLGTAALLALLAVLGFLGASTATARESVPFKSVALAELPAEARQTLQLIKQGGPFPHAPKDGSIFGNFEKRPPLQARAYYQEYTVPTPGRRDRGARRIVAGAGSGGDVATSGEYYYTGDHYRSFRRIRE